MWYKVKRIMVWDKQVRPSWWTPWANTLAYYPLTSTTTVNDMSWNGKNFSNTNVTFWTYQWVDCAYFSWNNCQLRNTSLPDVRSTNWTVLCWSYFVWNWSTGSWNLDEILWRWWWNTWVRFDCYGSSSSYLKFLLSWCYPEYNLKDVSKWVLSVSTYNATTYERNFYINWTLQCTWSWQMNSSYVNYLTMSNTQDNSSSSSKRWKGWASELILENKIWTADEILNYYNQTKSKYWL